MLGERKKPFEEKQARNAKNGGFTLKGDSEQRRTGWGNSEKKAAFFECGHTDHFKAQCPIWIKKKEKWLQEGKPEKERKEKGKEKDRKSQLCFRV